MCDDAFLTIAFRREASSPALAGGGDVDGDTRIAPNESLLSRAAVARLLFRGHAGSHGLREAVSCFFFLFKKATVKYWDRPQAVQSTDAGLRRARATR